MQQAQFTSRFPSGRIVITANAALQLSGADIDAALQRHLRSDWGEIDLHDRQENDRALRHGGRLFSVFRAVSGQRFYIITETDRSVTTLLLPEDY